MAPDNHYFSPTPRTPSRPGTIEVRARGLSFELQTDRGTFSPGRLDPGTTFLLERAPAPPPEGRFLDLGCGYGPLAAALALQSPGADVVAVDVNERSRQLCAANAAALGLDNITVRAPEEVSDEPFDRIWSNPPVRIGKPALHDLLLRWLGSLQPDGEAVLVVNRHLGADSLHRWLTDSGFPTDRVASRRGYRILVARPHDEVGPRPSA